VGISNDVLSIDLYRFRNSGRIVSVRAGRISLHLVAGLATDTAQAAVEVLARQRKAEQAEANRQANRRWREANPRKKGANLSPAQLAQRMAALEKGWQARREKDKAKAKDPLTSRVQMARGRKANADAINRLAAKIKSESLPKSQPAGPVSIVWPANVKTTVSKAAPGRFEVLDAVGPFSSTKPGQYVFEAASCAAKATV
jgi:hypothetical protein